MAYDKKLHLIAGVVIAVFFGLIADPITGLGAAIAAGIMKECYDDWHQDGAFDPKDMAATWAGGCIGFALVSLVNYWR